MAQTLQPFLALAVERPLTRDEAAQAFDVIMSGDATPAQTAGFLVALRMRGETVDEIAAAASVMRSKALAVSAPEGAIDIVGTGGDGKGTLNISTTAALIVAGAGVPVAKHGNRALSSQSGASDALAALGVDLDAPAALIERALREAGIGYMAAPNHHTAMKYVMPVRREMGVRTVFNILGPLTNPAGVRRQLTGAFSAAWLRPMARTLGALGAERAWLVHGGDGADEISICAPTTVVAWEGSGLREFEIAPEDAGLPRHDFSAIAGGDAETNAARLRALLDGARDGYRDACLLNAAAALVVAGRAADLREGAALAAESVDSGAAKRALERLAAITSGAE